MEPKFLVETTIDAEIQLEASRGVMPKATRILSYICIGITVVLLGVMIWQYVLTRNSTHLLLTVLLAVVLAATLFNQIRGPRSALKRWQTSIQNEYGVNALHLRTEFYELTLAQTLLENDTLTDAGYSAISQIKETEHLFLLHNGKQKWFFINKEGFRVGTPEEFRTFIQSKIGG